MIGVGSALFYRLFDAQKVEGSTIQEIDYGLSDPEAHYLSNKVRLVMFLFIAKVKGLTLPYIH